MAKVRQQAQVGVLADAFGDETFCRALVAAIGAREQLKLAHGTLLFKPTHAFAHVAGDAYDKLPVAPPGAQSSNTIVTLGERLFLKAYRRVAVGLNPEVEIGRFLTDVVRFPHSVPVAGSVDYVGRGRPGDHAGTVAGVRGEPGQRVGLHAELSQPAVRGDTG